MLLYIFFFLSGFGLVENDLIATNVHYLNYLLFCFGFYFFFIVQNAFRRQLPRAYFETETLWPVHIITFYESHGNIIKFYVFTTSFRRASSE